MLGEQCLRWRWSNPRDLLVSLGWNGWTWVSQSRFDVSWTPKYLQAFVGTSGSYHRFSCVSYMTRHFDLLKVIFHVFPQWQSKEISSYSCRQSESFFITLCTRQSSVKRRIRESMFVSISSMKSKKRRGARTVPCGTRFFIKEPVNFGRGSLFLSFCTIWASIVFKLFLFHHVNYHRKYSV